jgi:hypothetical protein
MGDIVQDTSLSREAVLFPLPLDVDQRGLAKAVDRMLAVQRSESDRRVPAHRLLQNNSTTSTDSGSLLRFTVTS